jgi:hypothetical protein
LELELLEQRGAIGAGTVGAVGAGQRKLLELELLEQRGAIGAETVVKEGREDAIMFTWKPYVS